MKTEWERCAEPTPDPVGYTKLAESEFSFTIKSLGTGEVFKCSVDWHGRSNWFKRNPNWTS